MFGIRTLGSNPAAVLDALDKSLATIEFDPKGMILKANPRFCDLMGYRLEEIKGQHHSIFVDPDYAKSEAYKAFWAKLARGDFDTQEYRRIAKGGKHVWIQASYNPVRNRRGRVVKIVKVASDTTQARLLSADTAGKMTAISRVQAVIEFTPDGEILTANENFLNALGYRLDEIRGKHHSMFVDPAERTSPEYQAFWKKLRSGEFVAAEFRRIGKDGREIWIQASYNPIFDLQGRVDKIVKFATDITERVRAVETIADGLAELAQNNLEHRLERPFEAAFETVRSDYNRSLDGLQSTIAKVAGSADTINTAAQQIAASSDDMSRRIEQQAASLEQTAAALDEITATVKRSAEGTKQAAGAASGAKSGAVTSGAVMQEAAAAMTEIEQSSGKITQIIGVIDEIAFQTSLLALNASVEAARAGDAGRGFAVVAQEVRALAQRSAGAAKEIKTLIASSSEEVKRGVKLVGDTAAALGGIFGRVTEVDVLLSEMATAAQEQATGLAEVNTAVNQMDQVTQQNAAMLEEATAAAAGLKVEANDLAQIMGQFRIRSSKATPARAEPVPLRVVSGTKAAAAARPATR